MFLSKHKNGYYYVYYSENGKRKNISTKTKSKREATDFLISFKAQVIDRRQRKIVSILLSKLIFEFLKYSESVHSYNHTVSLKSTFKAIKNYTGEIHASELTREKILNYIQYRSRLVTPFTVKRDIESLSSLFGWGIDHNYFNKNICKGIRRPRLPEKLPIYFTKSEFNILLDNTSDDDLKDIFIFAVNTGLRQMELLRLEWNQIDIAKKVLYLDNRNHLTKSKRIRVLPLNDTAITVLKRRAENKESNHIVFTYHRGPMNQQFISHKIKKIIKQAGINQQLNFHSLRHTFASWLVQAGVSIYEVSKLLGHSNIRTTEIYAHLEIGNLHEAVKKL